MCVTIIFQPWHLHGAFRLLTTTDWHKGDPCGAHVHATTVTTVVVTFRQSSKFRAANCSAGRISSLLLSLKLVPLLVLCDLEHFGERSIVRFSWCLVQFGCVHALHVANGPSNHCLKLSMYCWSSLNPRSKVWTWASMYCLPKDTSQSACVKREDNVNFLSCQICGTSILYTSLYNIIHLYTSVHIPHCVLSSFCSGSSSWHFWISVADAVCTSIFHDLSPSCVSTW